MHNVKILIVGLALFLITSCATKPNLTASYEAFEVPTAREVQTISPDLLVPPKLTPLPETTDWPSVHKRSIILGTDLAATAGQLNELIGAEKQRVHSERLIIAAEKKRAAEVKALLTKMNKAETRRALPWYKKLLRRKDK